jgi:predicted nucleic acid-binding protein
VNEALFEFPVSQRIVVADANVLFSRVLRDYLLYATSQEIVNIVWSTEIIGEAAEHMMKRVAGFDQVAADRLVALIDAAYPASLIDPGPEDFQKLEGLELPDEDDRHVIATALAAEADAICTNDKTGFPSEVLGAFGIEVVTADAPIHQLIERYPQAMLTVHLTAVRSLRGATDQSTLAALRRAKAPRTAEAMTRLLEIDLA